MSPLIACLYLRLCTKFEYSEIAMLSIPIHAIQSYAWPHADDLYFFSEHADLVEICSVQTASS